jgi:catalase
MAIRFNLAEHVHTDIVAHSANGFPATTGQEFLEFLRGVTQSDPAKVQAFVGSHPKALAFVQAITPLPASFAKEKYFGLTAMKFTNKDGVSRYGRYTIVPEPGEEHLDAATAAAKRPDYLFNELNERLAKGPIKFKITVQVAEDGDVVNDATAHWPAERKVVELGTIALTSTVANHAHEQKRIIFDPIPRLDGTAPSDDPLLELRAAVYLISSEFKQKGDLETKLAALEGQQKELAAALEDPAAYTPGGHASAINRDLTAVSHDLARLTAEWENVTATVSAP